MDVLTRPLSILGHRLPAEQWNDYRAHHDFRGPSCLCSGADPEHSYTEALVFQVTDPTRPLFGKYVAACAQGVCKYWCTYPHDFILKESLTDADCLIQ